MLKEVAELILVDSFAFGEILEEASASAELLNEHICVLMLIEIKQLNDISIVDLFQSFELPLKTGCLLDFCVLDEL